MHKTKIHSLKNTSKKSLNEVLEPNMDANDSNDACLIRTKKASKEKRSHLIYNSKPNLQEESGNIQVLTEEDSQKDNTNEESSSMKKEGVFTRRLWSSDEDKAILKLVKKYGTKRWTLISKKLQDVYKMHGRSGKQCRER